MAISGIRTLGEVFRRHYSSIIIAYQPKSKKRKKKMKTSLIIFQALAVLCGFVAAAPLREGITRRRFSVLAEREAMQQDDDRSGEETEYPDDG